MGQGARVPAGRRPAGRAHVRDSRRVGAVRRGPASGRTSGRRRRRSGDAHRIHEAKARLYFVTSDFDRSAAEGERILPLARLTGNRIKEAEALATIAWASTWGRNLDAAIRFSRGGARRRRAGRRAGRAGAGALHDRVRARRDRRPRRESCGARKGDRDQQRRGRRRATIAVAVDGRVAAKLGRRLPRGRASPGRRPGAGARARPALSAAVQLFPARADADRQGRLRRGVCRCSPKGCRWRSASATKPSIIGCSTASAGCTPISATSITPSTSTRRARRSAAAARDPGTQPNAELNLAEIFRRDGDLARAQDQYDGVFRYWKNPSTQPVDAISVFDPDVRRHGRAGAGARRSSRRHDATAPSASSWPPAPVRGRIW